MFGERKGAHAISSAVRWQCGSVDTASGVGVGAFLPAAVARELDSSSHWDDIGWLRKHSTPQSIRVAAPRQRSEKSTREGPIRGGEEKFAHDVAPQNLKKPLL